MLTLHDFTTDRAREAVSMLCEADMQELSAAGIGDAVAMLAGAVPQCAWAVEARWNGKPVAVYGVRPLPGDDAVGVPWMLTTVHMESADSGVIAHAAMRAVRRMRREYRLLVNQAHASNERALRFIEALGFVIDPAPCGNGGEFRRFWWRRNV